MHAVGTKGGKTLTCDQASLFFFHGRKERLIQLLDYSSAAPKLKYLSARILAIRMNQAQLPEVASWAGIT